MISCILQNVHMHGIQCACACERERERKLYYMYMMCIKVVLRFGWKDGSMFVYQKLVVHVVVIAPWILHSYWYERSFKRSFSVPCTVLLLQSAVCSFVRSFFHSATPCTSSSCVAPKLNLIHSVFMFIIAQCLRIDIDITCTSQTFAPLSHCSELLLLFSFQFSISNSYWFVHFSLPHNHPQIFPFLQFESSVDIPMLQSHHQFSSSLAQYVMSVCDFSFYFHVHVHSVKTPETMLLYAVCVCVRVSIYVSIINMIYRIAKYSIHTLTHEMLTTHSIPMYFDVLLLTEAHNWLDGVHAFSLIKAKRFESGFSVRFGNSQEKLIHRQQQQLDCV